MSQIGNFQKKKKRQNKNVKIWMGKMDRFYFENYHSVENIGFSE